MLFEKSYGLSIHFPVAVTRTYMSQITYYVVKIGYYILYNMHHIKVRNFFFVGTYIDCHSTTYS